MLVKITCQVLTDGGDGEVVSCASCAGRYLTIPDGVPTDRATTPVLCRDCGASYSACSTCGRADFMHSPGNREASGACALIYTGRESVLAEALPPGDNPHDDTAADTLPVLDPESAPDPMVTTRRGRRRPRR